METFFDELHAKARRVGPLYRLAIVSRLLLALAFFPTGMVKLLGNRFTVLGTDTAVGAFFEAMYQSGYYWNFIGAGQVVAALLLLIPATATLGAVTFFPIMLNITVLTWSIGFEGTIYVTALMLLANVFLLCWDYDRLRTMLFSPAERPPRLTVSPLPRVERAGYGLGGVAAMIGMLATRGLVPSGVILPMLGACAVAALLVVWGWVQAARGDSRAARTR